MVTVFLRGGLGNQMFQYALGLRMAKANGTALAIDAAFLNDRFPRPQFTYRNYDLDVFRVTPEFTALSKASIAVPIPGVWLGIDLSLMAAQHAFGFGKIIKEKSEWWRFDPAVLAARGDTVLWGRWQSEKYFADVAHEVRDAFRFAHPFDGVAAELADEIRGTNSISIHVRRGDFVNSKNMLKIVGDTDLSYYDRAIAHVAEHVPNPNLFVFSDDIAWCRENIKPQFKTTYLTDASRGPKAAFHLELMSLCKHNIITNSSFSWWGAWLNENPAKTVIAPKRWTLETNENDDIVPARWTRI